MTKSLFAVGISSLAFFLASTQPAQARQHHHNHHATEQGLTVGGEYLFEVGMADQDVTRNYREVSFINATELYFTYHEQAESGLRYGAVIELKADVSADFRQDGDNADKTYLFLESALGRLELGAVDDAGHRLGVNAASLARGSGGIHGDWVYFTRFPADEHSAHGHGGGSALHLGHGDFIHSPNLPLHHAHGAAADANKISWYSPEFLGFRAGFSYLPDSGDSGTAAAASGKSGHREFNDVLNGGVSWQGKAGEVGIHTSLTGETGRSELPGHENLGAYAAGLVLDYHGFSVGGSYLDWNQSVTHITPNNSGAQGYTLGAGYDFGNGGVSLGWMHTTYQRNDTNVLSLSADYTLAAGLTPFAELSLVSMDAADPTVQDNDATVGIAGVLLNF